MNERTILELTNPQNSAKTMMVYVYVTENLENRQKLLLWTI